MDHATPPRESSRHKHTVGRRSLVRGAAWTVPVIATATAAPAYALSCTTEYNGTLNWGSGYTAAGTTGGNATVTMSGAGGTVNLTMASTFTGYTPLTTTPANYSTLSTVGGTGQPGLTLTQVASSALVTNNPANNQTIKFTFDRPVHNLSFLVTDIDFSAGQYKDAVAFTGATFTSSVPTGSSVSGAGTSTSPFANSTTTAFDNSTGVGGNIRVTFPGSLTTFNMVYWNALIAPTATSISQGTWLSTMTFQTYNPGCPT